jgi:outer membrane protein assembly factor BamB
MAGATIFMSYTSANAAIAEQLRQRLGAAGVAVWIDHERISPGTPDWDEAVRKGIQASDMLVYVASPSARASPFVKSELLVAQRFGRRIIPLWAAGEHWIDAAPLSLGTAQYIDVRGERFDGGVGQLLEALGVQQAEVPVPAPPRMITPQDASPPRASPSPVPSAKSPAALPVSQPGAPRRRLAWMAAVRAAGRRRSVLAVSGALAAVALVLSTMLVALHTGILGDSTGEHGGTPPAVTPRNRLWEYEVGSPVTSSLVVADNVVYVGSHGGVVYALDAGKGIKIREFSAGGAVGTPAVANGVVYVGAADSSVYALRADTGAYLWKLQAGDLAYFTPAVVGGVVYVGSSDGSVYALSASNGTQSWVYHAPGPVYTTPAVADGEVYVTSENVVYALDAGSGIKRWNASAGDLLLSAPVVVNGVIYVGSYDDNVYALDARAGTRRWAYLTGGSVVAAPAVASGVVYFGSRDGWVYALKA